MVTQVGNHVKKRKGPRLLADWWEKGQPGQRDRGMC